MSVYVKRCYCLSVCIILMVAVVVMAGTNCSSDGFSSSDNSSNQLVSIDLQPDTINLEIGENLQCTAIGTYRDSSTADITDVAEWSSSAGAAAVGNEISNKGLISALSAGNPEITVVHDGVYCTMTITVTANVSGEYTIEPYYKNVLEDCDTMWPACSGKTLLSFGIDASGLTAPCTFTIRKVISGSMEVPTPDLVSLDSATGMFSWTPTPSQVGEYYFIIDVADASSDTAKKIIKITVPEQPVCSSSSAECTFIKEKYLAGEAAGNKGDWYHNSDRFHAKINLDEFPQADLMYTYAYTAQYSTVRYGKVIVGNSSTAVTSGESWRSQQRGAMTSQYYMNKVYLQYSNNNMYWYPEHRDHDEVDYYHGKSPYICSSQGSSGSELDEVRKFFYTLAAFKPEVKNVLIKNGLLMPALQMIFRRSRVTSDSEYLSGTAHPSAFDNTTTILDQVTLANAIEPGDIPPMVQMEVVSETYTDNYEGKTERLFTTPDSICRIFRSMDYSKEIVVSLEGSYDINSRPLTYHWAVLRGDTDHVRIIFLNAEQSIARIEIDYHPKTVIEGSTRETNMVEIGVFVHNGIYYSAPGFVTSYTLDNEERTYMGQILTEIIYNSNYVYPPLL